MEKSKKLYPETLHIVMATNIKKMAAAAARKRVVSMSVFIREAIEEKLQREAAQAGTK